MQNLCVPTVELIFAMNVGIDLRASVMFALPH